MLLVVVIFSVMNVDPVSINFGFTVVSVPLVVVIIGTLLVATLIAVIWSTTIILKEKNEHKRLRQQLDTLQIQMNTELSKLEERHLEEKQQLQQMIDNKNVENRDLHRRIKNLETSRSISKNDI